MEELGNALWKLKSRKVAGESDILPEILKASLLWGRFMKLILELMKDYEGSVKFLHIGVMQCSCRP